MDTTGRAIRTVDTYSTSKNMKSTIRNNNAALRRQIVMRLKTRLVKYGSFSWRDNKLYLNLKYNIPNQL